MKKILIFSAKIPGGSLEADGGSMTVAQLVQNLYGHYHIDYMYLKKKSDEKPNPTREIENFYEADGTFLSYHTYNQENADKFLVRIENKTRVSRCIADIIGQYDAVIIIHCLQAFGLADFLSKEQLDKIILYPMFLSPSYHRAGDIVPEAYRLEEKKVLNAVGTIITPSDAEKRDIITEYSVDSTRVHVIPRGIPENIFPRIRNFPEHTVHICCVGSFKNQKNNLNALKFFNLLSKTVPAVLHMVGGVQDRGIYEACKDYLRCNQLHDSVLIEQYQTTEMAEFYDKMDLAVSLSSFETFGRAIFEGMASGLPTFAMQENTTVQAYTSNSDGILFCKDYQDMAFQAEQVLRNRTIYCHMSEQAIQCGMQFTNAVQKQKTLAVLAAVIEKETLS